MPSAGMAAFVTAVVVFLCVNAWSGLPSWSPIQRVPGEDSRFREEIEDRGASIVLLGNSMLGEGIDIEAFEQRIGQPTAKIAHGGAASAWWWVVFRNQIAAASPPPEHVVVFFRDAYLTDPAFRTRGHYKPRIDQFSSQEESVLDDLAYTRPLAGAELWLCRLLPLYRNREVHQLALKHGIRDLVSEWVPRAQGGVDGVLRRVFADEHMQPELVTQRQLEAEATAPVTPPFAGVLPDAFLGPMFDLAESRGIQLHFVRVKRRSQLTEPQSESLVRHVAELRRYVETRGALLLDYSEDDRIGLEHFGNGDHLNREAGRRLFTQLVADDLAAALAPGG